MAKSNNNPKRGAATAAPLPPKKKARFDLPSSKKPATPTTTKDVKGKGKSSGKANSQPHPTTPKKAAGKKSEAGAAKPAVAAPSVAIPPLPTTFIVCAGSYERLLYGLSCTFVPSESTDSSASPYTLKIHPIFAFPAHLSSLRALAISTLAVPAEAALDGVGTERRVGGKYLVSGGTDEVVKVWDLKRRKEVGTLDGDVEGTITTLTFVPHRTTLLLSTTSGQLALYRVRDFVLLRTLTAHKGRVNCVDAHPAGRVALSVGQDKMLRMWDLVAGKAVATLKLEKEGECVRWSGQGTVFAVSGVGWLELYSLDMSPLLTLSSSSRFHDVKFCILNGKEVMFVACEDGKTRVFAVPATAEEGKKNGGTPIAVLEGHSMRVKQLELLDVAYPLLPSTSTSAAPLKTQIIASTSSDGKINVYDLSLLSLSSTSSEPPTLSPSASHDTDGSRLTCITAVGVLDAVARGLRKEMGIKDEGVENEEEGESDDSESDEEESGSEAEDDGEEFGGIASGGEEEGEFDLEDEEEDEDEEEKEEE